MTHVAGTAAPFPPNDTQLGRYMAFKLKFAPHLGFPTVDTPLFDALVGSRDPVDHMRFAAAHGFEAIQDPFAATRGIEDQARIGEASAELGLEVGCFVFAPMATAQTPLWTGTNADDRANLSQVLDEAFAIARRINSHDIAVLTGFAADRPKPDQRAAMSANLAWAGELAAAQGCRLVVEAVNARRLPEMLLHRIADAIEVVRAAAHPAVRLIFDYAHAQAMDGDIIHHVDLAWDHLEIIQIADNPDRVEPGAGELNFVRLLDHLVERGFSGLCELEHRWSSPARELQQGYLEWLDRWRI